MIYTFCFSIKTSCLYSFCTGELQKRVDLIRALTRRVPCAGGQGEGPPHGAQHHPEAAPKAGSGASGHGPDLSRPAGTAGWSSAHYLTINGGVSVYMSVL